VDASRYSRREQGEVTNSINKKKRNEKEAEKSIKLNETKTNKQFENNKRQTTN
jgi:hypothetical protein